MARDIQDSVRKVLTSDSARTVLGTAVAETIKSFGGDRSNGSGGHHENHQIRAGMGGLAAGAGAAALAPVAAKGLGKLIKGEAGGAIARNVGESVVRGPKKLAEGAGSKLGDTVGDKVTGKIDEAGGPAGILKDTVKSALPFGGGGKDRGKGGVPGVGKGRRMPVQQAVDIGVPIETVYNQWTQFEEWPNFMHRVTRVTQKNPCEVSFATKIWGKTKEFTAHIETERPDERIKWRVTEGMIHTGVVTFHELAPRLTRVELGLDVEPGSLLEKAARGMRHVKRAARGDLHRFKAFIELLEHETGAWRGVIEDGEVVKDHDPRYDRQREYGSIEDLTGEDAPNGGDPEKRQRASRRGGGGRKSGSGSARGAASGRSSRASSSSRGSGSSRRAGSSGGSSSSRGSGSSGGSSSSRGSGSSRGSSSGRGSSSSGGSRSSRASASSRGASSSRASGGGRSTSGRSSSGSSRSGTGGSSGSSRSRGSSARTNGRGRTQSRRG